MRGESDSWFRLLHCDTNDQISIKWVPARGGRECCYSWAGEDEWWLEDFWSSRDDIRMKTSAHSLSLNIQSFSRSFAFCSLIHQRFLLDITEDLVEKEKAFTGVFSPFESWRNHEWRDVRMSREIMPCSTQEALWEMRFNLLSLECNPDVNTQQQLWEHLLNPSEWKIMQKIQNNGRNSSKTGTQGSKRSRGCKIYLAKHAHCCPDRALSMPGLWERESMQLHPIGLREPEDR